MISLAWYWMGRDSAFADVLTFEIRRNAIRLVEASNKLLAYAAADGVVPGVDRVTRTPVASGWRPPGVNARTRNAAIGSSHLDGLGIDLQDDAERALARWCLRNLARLEECELYMEDPRWTGGADPWVHWQLRRPGSGNRVYVPSSAAPTAAALPEQEAA